MEKSLKLGESYTNQTEKTQEVQVSYYNAFGLLQTHFTNLYKGQTITRTKHDNVVIIYAN